MKTTSEFIGTTYEYSTMNVTIQDMSSQMLMFMCYVKEQRVHVGSFSTSLKGLTRVDEKIKSYFMLQLMPKYSCMWNRNVCEAILLF